MLSYLASRGGGWDLLPCKQLEKQLGACPNEYTRSAVMAPSPASPKPPRDPHLNRMWSQQ